MKIIGAFWGVLFILQCKSALPVDSLLNKDFSSINVPKTKINIATEIKKHAATVLIFYSPTCPICQSETRTIQDLYSKYAKDSVAFVLIFPQNYHTKKEIKYFLKTYSISIPSIRDEDVIITKYYNATVTPEAVVLDRYNNKIYSGKIDNLFEDIGKRRTIITEQYVKEAIDAVLLGKRPVISRTAPVGCILNYISNL